jgi:NTE family protein
MSISIPVFFEPVKLQYIDNDNNERTSYIIDGGVLSNYPVWLFDQCQMGGKVPTFGFKLMAPNEDRGHDIKGPVSLLSAVLGTMMEAHDIRYVEEKNFQRTVVIPTLDVRATDFNISRKKAEELFQSGVTAAEEFFGKWDYRTYLRKYGV